jgi:predicted porin
MQSFLQLRAWRSREAYADEEYGLTGGVVQAGLWPMGDLQVGAFAIVGDQIDYANARLGSRFRINPWMSYNLGRHIRLALNHNFERMRASNARLYTANISQLTAVYQFNVRTFSRAIIQYVNYDYNQDNYTFQQDSEDRRLFTQLLFSYKFNPRTVLFLGYADNHRGNQDFSITQSNRTFFVKLGYAWTI